MSPGTEFGETWVYESIVGAFPGVRLSSRAAIALQFAGFEAAVIAVGLVYGLESGIVAGTVAVAVAAAGSAAMLRLGLRIRALPSPEPYRRLLFGSSVEVVLGLVSYVALLTYLFAVDPRDGSALLTELLGPTPPAPAFFLLLLVLWDVCYRIGTGWWAAVAALYRSVAFEFEPDVAAAYRRLDAENAAFAAVQLVLVPLVADHPVLAVAVLGHVAAVAVVVALSVRRLTPR
ncbi:MAG: hypothetical protein ABEI39_05960 [Halobacteriales archaeon]